MWRFVHLTDPHLASPRDGEWNNLFLCSMMPEVMACLRRDLAALQPDFIFATGDIASQQTREAVFEARDLMDSLGIPYYPMGGNHDFVLPESRQWFLEAYHAHLPMPETHYAFQHKNLRFIALDPWWKWTDGSLSQFSEAAVAERMETGLGGARWVIPPAQLRWLAQTLSEQAATPSIIGTHYPALPIPIRMRRPAFRDGGCLDNGEDLLNLLSGHRQVKALFSGHVHLHFIERNNGIAHIVTGALPEYPVEYRVVDVFPDRLEIRTCALSDPQFAARSLLPGKSWTRGEEEDRTATIRLV
ncbi:MAG: metallophosphoesterase [Candidatus Hydrogenedentes bacterium]|nr:metallophosphoesterase [Candidatus Hydrogenedentota bacterium]